MSRRRLRRFAGAQTIAAVDMTLHLDPTSLAVWFEPPTHGDYATRRLLSRVGELALLERHDEAEDLVAGIDDRIVRRAGVELLSNVWHEQRHFVDLVLTNYGALRLRDHLLTYVNAGGLLSEAMEAGRPLMVPLSNYESPMRRAMFGLPDPPEGLSGFLGMMNTRRAFLTSDNTFESDHTAALGIGGQAQMEALAYLCQAAAINERFGRCDATDLYQYAPDQNMLRQNYMWFSHTCRALALTEDLGKEGDRPMIDGTVLVPLLYGALAVQAHRQRIEPPSSRLARLLSAAHEQGTFRGVSSTIEAWDRVNALCASLFGESALSSTLSDVRAEEELVETFADGLGDNHPAAAFAREVHECRRALVDILLDQPRIVLLPPAFRDRLLPRVHVPAIFAQPTGIDEDDVPPGWFPMFGSAARLAAGPTSSDPDSPRIFEERQEKWFWARARLTTADAGGAGLRSVQTWRHIAILYAPLAKMLLHGHRPSLPYGPETLTAEQSWRAAGLPITVAPQFRSPAEDHSVQAFWRTIGGDSAYCDGCRYPGTLLKAPGGALYSPWFFRRNAALEEWVFTRYGSTLDAAFARLRDWTGWLLCPACADEIEQLA
jgi:hypothetical protein